MRRAFTSSSRESQQIATPLSDPGGKSGSSSSSSSSSSKLATLAMPMQFNHFWSRRTRLCTHSTCLHHTMASLSFSSAKMVLAGLTTTLAASSTSTTKTQWCDQPCQPYVRSVRTLTQLLPCVAARQVEIGTRFGGGATQAGARAIPGAMLHLRKEAVPGWEAMCAGGRRDAPRFTRFTRASA